MELLLAVILNVCGTGDNPTCWDYFNNCAVGKGGVIEAEVVRKCEQEYFSEK